MQKKTHLAFGTLAGLSAMQVMPLSLAEDHLVMYVAAVAVGSLLPDIDHPRSTLGRKLPGISHLISTLFGHRKFFHSLLFVTLLALTLPNFFSSVVSFGLLIGVASHLLGDMMTRSGIQLLFPLKWMIKLPITFRTGGIVEYALFFVFSALAIYMGKDILTMQGWF